MTYDQAMKFNTWGDARRMRRLMRVIAIADIRCGIQYPNYPEKGDLRSRWWRYGS